MTETLSEATVCSATRANGQPCQSTLVDETGVCIAHRRSPSELAASARAAGIRSGEVRKERSKSVREQLADRALAQVEAIAGAYEAGLAADDVRIRYQAADAFLNQAFGKPLQPTREEGGMLFAHPLLSGEDIHKLNAAKNGKADTSV